MFNNKCFNSIKGSVNGSGVFRDSRIPVINGAKMIFSRHLINVEVLKINDKSYLIGARIIRQTSVTLTPYKTLFI